MIFVIHICISVLIIPDTKKYRTAMCKVEPHEGEESGGHQMQPGVAEQHGHKPVFFVNVSVY